MAKILVLDDQPIICEFICTRLTEEGHEVRVAYAGDVAIDLGYLFNPDILITDWHLKSEYDGLEVCEAVQHANENIKSILISGYSLDEMGSRIDGLNIVSTLVKPFSIETLVKVVEEAISPESIPSSFSLN